jgi:hypothetical protein
MHQKHPEMAKQAGKRGGEATAGMYALGRRGWGLAMAMKRWHSAPTLQRSRAPKTGLDDEEGGTSESNPVSARLTTKR